MELNPVGEELYRLKFREYLRQQQREKSEPEDSIVIADTYVSRPADLVKSIPLDPGEIKHTVADQSAAADNAAPLAILPGIEEISEKKPSAHYYRYVMYDTSLVARETKQLMEDMVRRTKRSSAPCPHCGADNLCSKLTIRCGERMQYSTRETPDQRHKPHRCNYDPKQTGSCVLVVDDDRSVRDFLRNSFVLFLGYDDSKIHMASSAQEAITLLNRCKLDNKRCGLVVCDIALAPATGFDLVNEIFYRNYNTNVILMKEKSDRVSKPAPYAGDAEIVPGESLVRAEIEKPFHSEEFVRIVRSIRPPA
jgi:CheY-like chemotaxis protein